MGDAHFVDFPVRGLAPAGLREYKAAYRGFRLRLHPRLSLSRPFGPEEAPAMSVAPKEPPALTGEAIEDAPAGAPA
jgi:hypothetical protein